MQKCIKVGDARCLAGITAQKCATGIELDTGGIVQLVEQWHTLTPGAGSLARIMAQGCQVSCGINPSPRRADFETLGGPSNARNSAS